MSEVAFAFLHISYLSKLRSLELREIRGSTAFTHTAASELFRVTGQWELDEMMKDYSMVESFCLA